MNMDNLEKIEPMEIYQKYLPKNVTTAQLDRIGEVSSDLYQIAQIPNGNAVKGVLLAQCLSQLRELFTPEIMAPIMSLQGSPLGFLTDRDKRRTADGYVKGDGYSWDIVRDCYFYCTAQGARITGNEMNILASNPYLTKKFFERMNNENLGRDKWRCCFEVPIIESQMFGGKPRITAIVSGVCGWTDKNGDHKENLTAKIKGDEYASNDAYTGKWERKAFKLVFEKSTGRKVDDGDVEDMMNVTPIDELENINQPRYQQPQRKQKSCLDPKAELPPIEPVIEQPNQPPVDNQAHYITAPQQRRLHAIAGGNNMQPDDIKKVLRDVCGTESTKEICIDQYDAAITAIENWQANENLI